MMTENRADQEGIQGTLEVSEEARTAFQERVKEIAAKEKRQAFMIRRSRPSSRGSARGRSPGAGRFRDAGSSSDAEVPTNVPRGMIQEEPSRVADEEVEHEDHGDMVNSNEGHDRDYDDPANAEEEEHIESIRRQHKTENDIRRAKGKLQEDEKPILVEEE